MDGHYPVPQRTLVPGGCRRDQLHVARYTARRNHALAAYGWQQFWISLLANSVTARTDYTAEQLSDSIGYRLHRSPGALPDSDSQDCAAKRLTGSGGARRRVSISRKSLCWIHPARESLRGFLHPA